MARIPRLLITEPPFFEIRVAQDRHQLRCLEQVRLECPGEATESFDLASFSTDRDLYLAIKDAHYRSQKECVGQFESCTSSHFRQLAEEDAFLGQQLDLGESFKNTNRMKVFDIKCFSSEQKQKLLVCDTLVST